METKQLTRRVKEWTIAVTATGPRQKKNPRVQQAGYEGARQKFVPRSRRLPLPVSYGFAKPDSSSKGGSVGKRTESRIG